MTKDQMLLFFSGLTLFFLLSWIMHLLKRNRTTYLILTGLQVCFAISFIAFLTYLLYNITDQFTEIFSSGWVAILMAIICIILMIIRNIHDNRKFKKEIEHRRESNES